MTGSPYKNLIRLHIPQDSIARGDSCLLSEGQAHYLRNVMRVAQGDRLRVFNGRNGEWLAELSEINKKKAIVTFVDKLREQSAASDIWALASPVKKDAFDMMVEKAAELGTARFLPALCEHTVVHRVNRARLAAVATEAAEQSERLDLMEVAEPQPLESILNSWPSGRKLIFCLERGDATPIARKLQSLPGDAPLAVLTGPEGGFSDREVALISKLPFALPVSLGPRILKAETALISALACIQALSE
jgi:16S rRNA (uracil1498-N3)-methyltransferase